MHPGMHPTTLGQSTIPCHLPAPRTGVAPMVCLAACWPLRARGSADVVKQYGPAAATSPPADCSQLLALACMTRSII
eukprot:347133-Chlamydomonas_euryale.AAC.1